EVDPNRERLLPDTVWVAPDGQEVAEGQGLRAAYVAAPFRFCLRCRVSYESPRQQDFAKLASLGSEGRSSATTVLASSLVRTLRIQYLPAAARKVLSFTDNRLFHKADVAGRVGWVGAALSRRWQPGTAGGAGTRFVSASARLAPPPQRHL